jgi:hypothetical protein
MYYQIKKNFMTIDQLNFRTAAWQFKDMGASDSPSNPLKPLHVSKEQVA